MRELDFATDRNIAEAFEEIKGNFEEDIADQAVSTSGRWSEWGIGAGAGRGVW